MRQQLHPAPGRIVIHREKLEDFYFQNGVWASENTPLNVWALVVAVGPDDMTYNGKVVKAPVKEGDLVAVAQIGMTVPIRGAEGEKTYLYVVPFDGIVAYCEAVCDDCGYRTRKEPRILVCPECGAGQTPEIIPVDANDIAVVQASRGRA